MSRPKIENINSGKELKKWYWLKEELVQRCKKLGINYFGSKFEVLERLAAVLDGAEIKAYKKYQAPQSKFDWAHEKLGLDTLVTDNYKSGANVRRFFEDQCGPDFRFSNAFTNWIKANVGITLGDAVAEWKRINALRKQDPLQKTALPASYLYNQYLRDFFADNPDKSIMEARRCWELKRALKADSFRYEKSDLDLV
jgi:Domain of unknown function (DUF6434)/SAP domain-containing new25